MIGGIDHVVLVVGDLDAAARRYEAIGFTVQPGGVHGGGASHNALIGFPDGSYIELFAFLDTANPRNPAWLASLQRGGGVTDLCLRTDDLSAEVVRLQAAGLPYPAPAPMSRRRPDGVEVAWRLSVPPPSADRWLPFLIEDDTPRELRVPSGEAARHPNRVTGIARVEIRLRGRDAIDELARAVDASPRWVDGAERALITVGDAVLDCMVVPDPATALGPARVVFHTPEAGRERVVENARLVL